MKIPTLLSIMPKKTLPKMTALLLLYSAKLLTEKTIPALIQLIPEQKLQYGIHSQMRNRFAR
ncbi:hypothetical protein EDC45_2065 [Mesocricetibacter intestinalis]|uniref:Uncharacterized protein n=1 Tax=Mesocricetibacter intestinalis TaxID=1521930 RepID=A0A4R6VFL7_9PAST|nr:hypothetical protein EDC45_2065 [Mesocricetibacter intestinalis]